MASEVRVELVVGDEVRPLGRVTRDTLRGSFRSDEPSVRRVFVFGFEDGKPGVWESTGVDAADPKVRRVVGVLTALSDLAEPFEQPFFRNGVSLGRIRFTAV